MKSQTYFQILVSYLTGHEFEEYYLGPLRLNFLNCKPTRQCQFHSVVISIKGEKTQKGLVELS